MVAKSLPSQAYLRECFIYDPETGTLTWRVRPRWHFAAAASWRAWNTKHSGAVAGYQRNSHGRYLATYVSVSGSQYAAHRLIWRLVTGRDPGPQIDHRDVNAVNNRWSNIRSATQSQNMRNRHGWGQHSRLKGITKNGVRWMARVQLHGTTHFLGSFVTPEGAHAAYAQSAMRLHGEFARIK